MAEGLEERLARARESLRPTEEAQARALEAALSATPAAAEGKSARRLRLRRPHGRAMGVLVLVGLCGAAGAGALALTALRGGAAPLDCPMFTNVAGTKLRYVAAQAPQIALDSDGNALAVWVGRDGAIEAAERAAGAASWSAPVPISPTGARPDGVSLVMNGRGDAVATWARPVASVSGPLAVSEAAIRPAGGGWQAPVRLSPPDRLTIPLPGSLAQAIGEQGDAIAIWFGAPPQPVPGQPLRPGGTVLLSALRPAGGTFGPARVIPQAQVLDVGVLDLASMLQVALDGQGNAVATWRVFEFGRGDLAIVGARLPAGSMIWEHPSILARLPRARGPVAQAQVAIDGAGAAVAVWNRGQLLVSATLPPAGRWSRPRVIANPGLAGADFQLVLNRAGQAVVVWRGRNRGLRGPRYPARHPGARRDRLIQAVVRSASGRWGHPTTISAAGIPVNDPQVGLSDAGQAVSLWVRGANDGRDPNTALAASLRPAGGAWQAPTEISPASSGPVLPRLALNARGDAAAVWIACSGRHATVQASLRPAGAAAWSPPQELP
jgi:hypothetical protein